MRIKETISPNEVGLIEDVLPELDNKEVKMASEILYAAKHGTEKHCTDLHEIDLMLVKGAVSHGLNESGIEKFIELHQIVVSGNYDVADRWKFKEE